MKLRMIVPLLTFLVGCPSPPDDAKAGPGGGGGPKGPPPAAKGDEVTLEVLPSSGHFEIVTAGCDRWPEVRAVYAAALAHART